MGLNSAVIEVAIGMCFVFLVLATVANAVTEGIAAAFGLRAKGIEGWLADNLGGADNAADAEKAVAMFYRQPVVAGLTPNVRHGSSRGASKRPSYIPSEHAITGLIQTGAAWGEGANETARVAAVTKTAVHTALERLPASPIRDALLTEWARAGGDLQTFRTRAEAWFDDAMDRLSGWYKRRIQVILLVLGLCLGVGLNADATHIAATMYRDPSVRQVVNAQAQSCLHGNCVPNARAAASDVNELPLPLGWTGPGTRFPRSPGGILIRLAGYLMTAGAIALGAPFWFDTLSKLVPLRSSGPPPRSKSAAA